MIEIKCPRCEQYWYDDDDPEGGVRLCSRCVDQLRLQRGHRAKIDIPFLIGDGVFLVFDVTMIALTALMPEALGKVTLTLGCILAAAGAIVWRLSLGEGGWGRANWLEDLDWGSGRWGLLTLLAGLALLGFALSRSAH